MMIEMMYTVYILSNVLNVRAFHRERHPLPPGMVGHTSPKRPGFDSSSMLHDRDLEGHATCSVVPGQDQPGGRLVDRRFTSPSEQAAGTDVDHWRQLTQPWNLGSPAPAPRVVTRQCVTAECRDALDPRSVSAGWPGTAGGGRALIARGGSGGLATRLTRAPRQPLGASAPRPRARVHGDLRHRWNTPAGARPCPRTCHCTYWRPGTVDSLLTSH
jgi:hypothetical protein